MPRLIAASDEQKRARDPLAHDAWGARLSMDQWLERESVLRAHPWSQETMTTWLWVESGQGNGDSDGDRHGDSHGEILASCESFWTPSRLHGADGRSFAIASVLTAPALRGKGYATALMAALVERLRQEPAAHCVTLYSDVGAPIYARSGYVATPARDWSVPPAAGDPAAAVDALLSGLVLPPSPGDPYHLRPTLQQLDWHVERERLYSRFFGLSSLSCRGARAGDGLALWVASRKSDELLVLSLSGAPAEVSSLLEAARRLAYQERLTRVVVWEDDHLAGHLPAFATRHPRDGALPMICPLDPRATASLWRHRPRALWV
jgi:GNAT superfamily N-acetyltransferase